MLERRLTWLAGGILLWGAAVFVKLVSLQVFEHARYADLARSRQELGIEVPAPRGAIFDRTGQPLAMSVAARTIIVNPLKINIESASDLLSRVLHLDRAQLYARMKSAVANQRGYLVVKRRVEQDEWERVQSQPVDYIDVQNESRRHYPNGALAAHVLGSVDSEEKGNYGIEKFLDADLRGVPGTARLLTDVKRRGIESSIVKEAKPGAALTLTIDARVQHVAERELAAAVLAHEATSGSAVVMNPNTGDIIALASYPTFNPNEPPKPDEPAGLRMNHAIEAPFEPGSVFKVITLSAALETTKLTPDSIIDCGHGSISLPGRVIHEAHGGYGAIPMAMVLAKSSNVGAIRVGMQVGEQNMFDYVRKFGFGQKTGIPLPYESRGRLRPLNIWGTTSLASVSMGQEISVTTVQLAQAASLVANGGLLVKPRLVLKRGNQPVPLEKPARAINAETAVTMRAMMEGVVLVGTGSKARLAGYTSGGKTGSAQIFDFATKHYTHSYNGSFMGFAPVGNPAIVIVVTLNGTHGTSGFGGAAAAPVFQAIASEALRVLDVPKDLPEEEKPRARTLLAKNPPVDAPPIDSGSGRPNILEDGDGEEQAATAPYPLSPGPKAPDFRGMSMRAVLSAASAKGLAIQPDGSGLARYQEPAPGAPLRQGDRIRVVFAR